MPTADIVFTFLLLVVVLYYLFFFSTSIFHYCISNFAPPPPAPTEQHFISRNYTVPHHKPLSSPSIWFNSLYVTATAKLILRKYTFTYLLFVHLLQYNYKLWNDLNHYTTDETIFLLFAVSGDTRKMYGESPTKLTSNYVQRC